jgi:hypothetical protein
MVRRPGGRSDRKVDHCDLPGVERIEQADGASTDVDGPVYGAHRWFGSGRRHWPALLPVAWQKPLPAVPAVLLAARRRWRPQEFSVLVNAHSPARDWTPAVTDRSAFGAVAIRIHAEADHHEESPDCRGRPACAPRRSDDAPRTGSSSGVRVGWRWSASPYWRVLPPPTLTASRAGRAACR